MSVNDCRLSKGRIKMYQVLIADDEKIIRMGLSGIIDWNSEGFSVSGQAANGRDALDYILTNQPDVVLIDIRMPLMTGLDVIRQARENGFKGRVIVLSGFSDFEYAKTAISYGVLAYLTKPVDKEALLQGLRKAKSELDEEKRQKHSKDSFLSKTRKSLLRGFLLGELDLREEEIRDLSLTHSSYQVLFCEDYAKDKKGSYRLADILRVANPNERELESITIDDRDVLLLKGHHPIERLKTLLGKYENELPPEDNSPLDQVFIACGSVVEHVGDIPRSYQEALLLLEHRFFAYRGQHAMVYDPSVYPAPDYDTEQEMLSENEKKEITEHFVSEYTERLINLLQVFNRKQIAETLHEMELYLQQSCPLSVDDQKKLLMDLAFSIKDKLLRLYNQTEIPFRSGVEVVEFFRNSHFLYELILFFTEQFDHIMTALGYTSRDNIIDDVISYIDHNYSTNITLETIAPLFGYNSSYLGKIFSRKMGQNFNTYLDILRVEKAKDILATTKAPVYRVAEMVGYRNVDYFHIKFKKYTGSSPAEYRKQILSS